MASARARRHDARVTRPHLAAFLFAAAPLLAQRALEPIDMLRLEFQMLLPAEEPLGWLDGAHHLVHDPGRPAMQGARSWYSVEAATCARDKLVDRKAIGNRFAYRCPPPLRVIQQAVADRAPDFSFTAGLQVRVDAL